VRWLDRAPVRLSCRKKVLEHHGEEMGNSFCSPRGDSGSCKGECDGGAASLGLRWCLVVLGHRDEVMWRRRDLLLLDVGSGDSGTACSDKSGRKLGLRWRKRAKGAVLASIYRGRSLGGRRATS
jgi:hypothetical protein